MIPALQRLPDWRARFAAYLQQRHCMSFAWGVHDCCQFARGDIIAITGRDPAASLKLRPYKTARGALGQLRRLGGVEAIPARLGLHEIALTYAQRGDLASGEVGSRAEVALGVVTGDKVAFACPEGLEFRPVTECRRAWRI